MIRSVPIIAIRGAVVFPHTDTLLSFSRDSAVSAADSAFEKDRLVAIFTQKDSRINNPNKEDLYEVGTLATITQMMSVEDGIHALVKGQARVKLVDIVSSQPYIYGNVEEMPEVIDNSPEVLALANSLSEKFKKALTLGKMIEVSSIIKLITDSSNPVELTDQIASTLDLKQVEKQEILSIPYLLERMKKVYELLNKEIKVLEIEKTLSSKTQKQFDEIMKKNILREKKKAIDKELGELDSDIEGGPMANEEVKEYKKKISDAKMPKDVEEKALKELTKLSKMSSYNPESGFLRNYLDWLCEVPWSISTPNNVKIKNAGKVMEKRHYGLKKTKERILEYLSVMKLLEERKKKGKENQHQPTILCFIGPPGVGKTSIGRAIAEAMGRKFVRMSLGGIRDEAEIRGHRRTYVGALPGRIIQGIKQAGTKNPVFMLDEIDKVGSDFRGDPSSALLEALDPEQNKEFSDHYLEVAFDLSEVFFIATGNIVDTIPSALRDRMEIIQFAGYTEEEKFEIGTRFIWPKQLKNHGLEDIKISDRALKEIINKYTRESGVRNLERNIATILRKVARLVAEKKKYPKVITTKHTLDYLGPHKYASIIAEKKNEVGMATGLAFTTAGGEILFIEVSLMPGRGRLTLTGQLGDVMKESAQAAFTWTRSNYKLLGLKPDFASKLDVHIHVPEGAVPKDGPSAGTSITTALVSALTKIATRRDTGMTGEISLRGNVMEIGGVKEKTIAGHRAGLKTIVLPKENAKDMIDVPERVKKEINFVYATKIEDVLKTALTKWPVV
jgi:ATP-dependent Lon protease